MGRSDARPLKVPARPDPPQPRDRKEAQPALKDKAEPQSPPSAVEPPVKLEACPHCGARLSPLDLKTNHCFRCNARLTAAAAPSGSGAESRYEVHI